MTTERSRPSAAEAHPDVFDQTSTIIDRFHLWIDRDIPNDGTALGVVKAAILVRAFNQYRSINNLLRDNHWEDGLILVRSLFELLLHTEELLRARDPEGAAARFFAFSQLQRYLEWKELELYQVATRRAGRETEERVARADAEARRVYGQFWFIDKKGKGRWRESWCNKKVADLVALSSNPIRPHQHRLLYGRGSSFTHSSPVAVFATMHHMDEPNDLAKLTGRVDALEERELRLVGSMASVFLLELAALIGDRLPDFDPLWLANEGTRLISRILRVPVFLPTIRREDDPARQDLADDLPTSIGG
ncbi:MAG: hypothetical protein HY002_06755 [Candidatus Rokubacteria bacterium]|nr:hypothetical protein [Candidatus Rokubacteria bacterium]